MEINIEDAVRTHIFDSLYIGTLDLESELYDIDLSGISAKVLSIDSVGKPVIEKSLLKSSDSILVEDCTGDPPGGKGSLAGYTFSHTESHSVTFGGTIGIGGSVGGKVALPLVAEGETQITGKVDFTASTTFSDSETKTVIINTDEVTCAPCKAVKATRQIWALKFEGKLIARILITGKVTYKVNIPFWNDPTYEFDVRIHETIDGKYQGVTGHKVTIKKISVPSTCAQPCDPPTPTHAMISIPKPRWSPSAVGRSEMAISSRISVNGQAEFPIDQPSSIDDFHGEYISVGIEIYANHDGVQDPLGSSMVKFKKPDGTFDETLTVPVTCSIPAEFVHSGDQNNSLIVLQDIRVRTLVG